MQDMYLIHPFLDECEWAVEDDRDGKENRDGDKFPKIFLCMFLFDSDNDMRDEDRSLAMFSMLWFAVILLGFHGTTVV